MPYHGFFIKERSKLLNMLPPMFSKIYCDHVTLNMGTDLLYAPGTNVTIHLTHHSTDDVCIETYGCYVVVPNGEKLFYQHNGRPLHCTWSLEPKSVFELTGKPPKPVDSGTLLMHEKFTSFLGEEIIAEAIYDIDTGPHANLARAS